MTLVVVDVLRAVANHCDVLARSLPHDGDGVSLCLRLASALRSDAGALIEIGSDCSSGEICDRIKQVEGVLFV